MVPKARQANQDRTVRQVNKDRQVPLVRKATLVTLEPLGR